MENLYIVTRRVIAIAVLSHRCIKTTCKFVTNCKYTNDQI